MDSWTPGTKVMDITSWPGPDDGLSFPSMRRHLTLRIGLIMAAGLMGWLIGVCAVRGL
jgi:hypothetical protein